MAASLNRLTEQAGQSTSHLDAQILSEIIASSSDACWCMEFCEPVDLTAPDREIVRQVFENNPFWRLSNPAMAQLYLLDPDMDFNSRPTAEIFPWNEQNEAFVRELITNGFEMDAGPALDMRYDGVTIYVENDVRAHIEGGQLLRMFGIVRDVGKHRLREENIKARLDEVMGVLADMPGGVITFDDGPELTLANPAACKILGDTAENLIASNLLAARGYSRALDAVRKVLELQVDQAVEDGGISWQLAPLCSGGVVGTIRKIDTEVQH